jgi:hypothetical protein
MDNHRSHTAGASVIGISSLLFTAVLLAAAPAHAQQASKLTASYAKAAHSALLAIESDTSAPQDENSEDIEIVTTQAIDIADQKAMTSEEKSLTETLRQIYQLKLHDNTVLRAYRVLVEVDSDQDPSDNVVIRRKKDDAVAEFADSQAAIVDGEGACFQQLEQSLVRRSPDVTACSEWIQKAKVSNKSAKASEDDKSSAPIGN